MILYPMSRLAGELGVTTSDIIVMAQVELDPEDYDLDTLTLSTAGADAMRVHFSGGVDPDVATRGEVPGRGWDSLRFNNAVAAVVTHEQSHGFPVSATTVRRYLDIGLSHFLDDQEEDNR
jgi:hypothetical protein